MAGAHKSAKVPIHSPLGFERNFSFVILPISPVDFVLFSKLGSVQEGKGQQ